MFGLCSPRVRLWLPDQGETAMTAEFDEDRFNMAIRKFLKHVGVTSQREIENLVRSGAVKGDKLKLRMTLSAEGTPLQHVVEETVAL
jgi:hypothetical protein